MAQSASVRRNERRAEAARKKRLAAQAAALQQEQRDEAIAPAVQRKDVVAGEEVIRHARLRRDGIVFIRSNPIRHLVVRSDKRLEKGEQPTFKLEHSAAAERLLILWDQVGGGVGIGKSDYGRISCNSGVAPSIPAGYYALLDQVGQQTELRDIVLYLGSQWPVVYAVVVQGITVKAWAESVKLDRDVCLGILRAALDRLIDFYGAQELPRRSEIRSMEFR